MAKGVHFDSSVPHMHTKSRTSFHLIGEEDIIFSQTVTIKSPVSRKLKLPLIPSRHLNVGKEAHVPVLLVTETLPEGMFDAKSGTSNNAQSQTHCCTPTTSVLAYGPAKPISVQ